MKEQLEWDYDLYFSGKFDAITEDGVKLNVYPTMGKSRLIACTPLYYVGEGLRLAFNREDGEVWTEGPLNGTKIKLVGTDSVSSLTISRYQEEAAKTAIYRKKDAIIYPALGLANEAGEVLGKIKKVLRDKGGSWDEDSKKEVGKEIGDVMWYLAALSRDLGLDLGILSQENLIKLKSRKERGVLGGSGDNR